MMRVDTNAARYQLDVQHQWTGSRIRLTVIVIQDSATGAYHISYSHVAVPTQGAGPWHTGSLTGARSLEDAEAHIQTWAGILSRCYEVQPW